MCEIAQNVDLIRKSTDISGAPLDDVECTGERSRAERDAELRRDAVDVDGSD